MSSSRKTRLAPSPTGALHLGNARTFLINWALARQQGWGIVLRIEDLDTPRVKPQAQQQAIDDLRWLGLDWDEGPYFQMKEVQPYRAALSRLAERGLIYPCHCTRKDIEAAQSAPHADDHELRYPGTCRPHAANAASPPHADALARRDVALQGSPQLDVADQSSPATGDSAPSRLAAGPALRLLVPDETITFTDEIAGPPRINVQEQVGDFIVATKAGLPAYQLAVVVDDARQGVTDIVRGDDLIRSAARQLLLYRVLDLTPTPRYWHVPLVVGEDGRRLAKRHGDTRLSWYREQGVPAERVIGLLAAWCGAAASPAPMSAEEFRQRFDIHRLPREQVVMRAGDHGWLLGAEKP